MFTDGRSVLLLRKAKSKATWGLPGGKSEDGETPIETALRESKEEIGKVKGARFAKFDEPSKDGMFTVYLYKVDKPFDVKLSKEHDDWQWIAARKLNDYRLHHKLKTNLPYYLAAVAKKFGS